jgi:predicted anti-sigma-YlaC factor YlaD
MMNCKQATQLLSEKMDRPLTTKEKLALKMHTTICSACRQFGLQMIDLRKISKAYVKTKDINEK